MLTEDEKEAIAFVEAWNDKLYETTKNGDDEVALGMSFNYCGNAWVVQFLGYPIYTSEDGPNFNSKDEEISVSVSITNETQRLINSIEHAQNTLCRVLLDTYCGELVSK